MKNYKKNKILIWMYKLVYSKYLEIKYRKRHLCIDNFSYVKGCLFGSYVHLYTGTRLIDCSVGDFSYISSNTAIRNTRIGKFCSIGPDCKIGLGKHPSRDFVSTHPIFFSTARPSQISFADEEYFEQFGNISVGNDVWIGSDSILLDGVSVGDGAIIAAGSVVTKNVPPYAIVGGVPAKIIRYRFEPKHIEKLLKIKWWNWNTDFLKKNFKRFHNIGKFLKFVENNNLDKFGKL